LSERDAITGRRNPKGTASDSSGEIAREARQEERK
jgi:hypothetical protein